MRDEATHASARGTTMAALAVLAVTFAGCSEGGEDAATRPVETSPPASTAGRPLFAEVAEELGVRFRHEASEGQYYIPEEMGPGGALLDIDGDEDLDLYLVQGGQQYLTDIGTLLPNRLYRNDGNGFTDITEASGAGDTGYGMGCAAADFDNDGDVDIYITNVGPDVLLENDGTGRFTDVTTGAGLGCVDFSSSASFVDYDHDGHLDLYVAVYMPWTPESEYAVFDARGERDYRNPVAYLPGQDRLYRNRGDGTFEDATDRTGVGSHPCYGLGVACADFDGDGLIDIYVANDHQGNFLWRNRGDGTFDEAALELGCAYNAEGKPEAGMGIICEDIESDGDFDLFITHFARETNTFYRNDGGYFVDATAPSWFGRYGVPETGFGAGMLDAENDGSPELLIVNGAVMRRVPPLRADNPYAERNLLLGVNGDGRFVDRTAEGGPALELVEMSRAAIFGDWDDDGDVDAVVTNNRGPAQLLRNENASGHHWIAIRAHGTRSNRDAIGAVVMLDPNESSGAASKTRRRQVCPQASYLSSSSRRVHFGLGDDGGPRRITIAWPSGLVESWADLEVDRVHHLREGTGAAVSGEGGDARWDATAPARAGAGGPTADAAPGELDALRERGKQAAARQAWLEAAQAYEDAVALGRRLDPEATTLAEDLTALGGLHARLRDHTRATRCFEEAVHIRRTADGGMSAPLAISMSQLGTAYANQGRLDEAERVIREAMAMLARIAGPDSLHVGAARRDLGSVLTRQNEFRQAEAEYAAALALFQRHLGREHQATQQMQAMLDATRRVIREAESGAGGGS